MYFKENIEWKDDYGFKNVNINPNVIYNGDYGIFNKTHYDTEYRQIPLAAAVLGLNNTDIPLPDNLDFHNIWTDMDAQESYLKQKPKTFLILGKQGTGSYNLGEALSKKINCVHLCPKNVLIDEIEQNSLTGKCLDFNMRHNKVCKFNIILSIIKEKLNSPAVIHRGSVISGIPLVTSSKNHLYFFSSLYSEESIMIIESILFDFICNFKRKKSKISKSLFHSSMSIELEMSAVEEVNEEQEIDVEEDKDQIAELPKFLLEPCSNIVFHVNPYYSTKKISLLKQVRELFDLNPNILIFITCPNTDIITKRGRKFLNYLNNSSTFFSFPTKIEHEVRWPTNYSLNDFNKPYESHIFNPKYNCKQPINFMFNAIEQLCNNKLTISPFIEQKLKDFDPNAIIKLDGRTSTPQMIHITMEKIKIMPIKSVVVPEPLYLDDPPDDLEEFWSLVEELNVIRSGVVKFNRYISFWYNRCPVELKKRKSTQGKPKFAVTFLKYIYLLSSLEAMVRFCRNPRPFLKLEYLEPTCRIVIIGTKSSGKTMIANCLSWVLNSSIICFSTFLENEKQKKYNEYAKTIFSEIISTIEDARFARWQNLELDRISKLNTWFNTQSSILNAYVSLLRKKMKHSAEQHSEEQLSFLNKLYTLRNQISNLPVDNFDQCEDLLKNDNLMKFAPSHLTIQISKPDVPSLGDQDVTDAISAYIKSNELEKEIETTPEEVMTEMIKVLKSIDSKSLNNIASDQVYGKFIIDGFSSNPLYWKCLIENNLLPDYTITLIENREVDLDLFQHYAKIEKCTKNYQERYLLSNDVIVKTKLRLQKPPETTELDMKIILEQFLSDLFDSLFIKEIDNNAEIQNDKNLLTTFIESVDKFRKDWDMLKLNIEENFKSFIEIELENKSDIQIIDEIFLKLRKSYFKSPLNAETSSENQDDENEIIRDDLNHNDAYYLGETNIYCPVAFYDHGVLWKGKSEFSTKHASRVPVPDERFDYLCTYHKPASKVPAFLNVVDIAGLVRGAAEGQGLGNAFLSHIKACDAIFNLCRAFDDEDVIHVDGDVNPIRDLETIGEELRLKDEEQLLQNIEKLDRVVNRGGEKKLKPEYETLSKIKTVLVDEKKHIRFADWSAADIEVLNKYLFLTSKPALYLVNLSEKDYIRKKNKWLPKLKEWIDKNDPGAPLIPFSGVLESKLLEMEPDERQTFLKENNVTSALDKIIVQGYKALQLEYFFTAGPDEVKAWTIQKGTKAPQAAGRIHTDFEKGFIMAEVMHYKDFKEEGTEAACKSAGKYRQQGRNYVVEDGDIIFFKFNAGAGLKDAKKK